LEKNSLGSARNIKIGLSLLGAALLQVTLVQHVSQGLRHIDWLLLVVVYVALQQRNHLVALWTATLAGILKDASSGGPVFALSGMAYLFAAYLADRISALIVLSNLPVRIGTVAAASLVNLIIQLVGYQLLHLPLTPLTGQENLLAVLVLSLIGNLLASILLFALLDFFFLATTGQGVRRLEALRGLQRRRRFKVKPKKRFNPKPRKRSLFRMGRL
jgi:rod shape-determining protein MreD